MGLRRTEGLPGDLHQGQIFGIICGHIHIGKTDGACRIVVIDDKHTAQILQTFRHDDIDTAKDGGIIGEGEVCGSHTGTGFQTEDGFVLTAHFQIFRPEKRIGMIRNMGGFFQGYRT